MLEVPQELGRHLSQAGGDGQGAAEGRWVQLPSFALGGSESYCPGLVDGRGRPGVNLFTAARLRACTEAEV